MTGTKAEKFIIAAYYLMVSVIGVILVVQCLWGDIPAGAFGQPRSSKIPPNWVVPNYLVVIYAVSIASLLFSPQYPLVGLVVYLFISFLPAIHSPVWIYTQWIGIRTIIGMLALVGTLIYKYKTENFKFIFKNKISILFIAFLTWYIICAVAAYFRDGHYNPPLQFHPIQLFEALSMYCIIIMNRQCNMSLVVIAVTMAVIITIRSSWVQTSLIKDADIARITVISIPLVFYCFTYFKQWWMRVICFAAGCTGIWLVIYIQNRGAALGLVFIFMAFWLTSNKKQLTVLFGIPIAVMGSIVLFSTNLGERFLSLGSMNQILTKNLRIITWRGGFDLGSDHIFFGVGPGNFLYKIGEYAQRVKYHSAHNIAIDIFAESGVVGFLIYGILIFSVLTLCFKLSIAGCNSSRFVFMAIFAHLGVGMFLSQTMMVLPFILFAFPVICKIE
nr:O-antigen ligase family protein [uncultured Desulfobacter sp.]